MFRYNGNLLGKLFLATTALGSMVSAQFGLGGIFLPPASPPVPTANKTGIYSVGVKQASYMAQGLNLTYYWWYPAHPASNSTPYVATGGVYGQAVQDAPLDRSGAPYPLIIFSSGLAAYADAYYFYCQNLASHGYVVASLSHYDTKLAVPTSNATLRAIATYYQEQDDGSRAVELTYTEWFRNTQFAQTYRTQEIEAGLNTVLLAGANPLSPFFGAINLLNIGLSGHSLGAFYTLLVGGGFSIYCDYNLTATELNPNASLIIDISPCAFPARRTQLGPFANYDIRIKAIIPLAAPFFIPETVQIARAAAKVNTPMMIITGDDLELESTRLPQWTTFENAAGDAYWVMVANTSHYLVGDSYQFNPVFSLTLPDYDKADFVQKANVYMSYSSAFFDVYLKGNISAKTPLRTANSPFVADLAYRN
ncbi:alpha/beta-hydrolase [Stipitochalara longipes BDJ]|nr:alpha/beta-hydrolase [Stipitochalara longipes BDJ]